LRGRRFWGNHPETRASLERRYQLVRAAHWASTDEVQKAAPRAKVLNRERVRFEIAGRNYRLVAAFDFRRQIAFVKFTSRGSDSLDDPEFASTCSVRAILSIAKLWGSEIKRMEARKLTETVIGGAPPGSPLGSYGRDTDWRSWRLPNSAANPLPTSFWHPKIPLPDGSAR
jgi:mRNA interferase HigB